MTIGFDNVETIDNLGNHGFGGQGVKMSLKLIRKILKKQTLSIEQLIKEFFRERKKWGFKGEGGIKQVAQNRSCIRMAMLS